MIDLSQKPADWEPARSERTWLRSANSGELGWLVKRSGRRMVRLDRNPQVEELRAYHEGEWFPEEVQRPLLPLHVESIAFEADKALCSALGMHLEARRDWRKMTEAQRQEWAANGPKRHPARLALYSSIRAAMKEYVK